MDNLTKHRSGMTMTLTVNSCPICRMTHGLHKMDCQNAYYVRGLEAERDALREAVGALSQTVNPFACHGNKYTVDAEEYDALIRVAALAPPEEQDT